MAEKINALLIDNTGFFVKRKLLCQKKISLNDRLKFSRQWWIKVHIVTIRINDSCTINHLNYNKIGMQQLTWKHVFDFCKNWLQRTNIQGQQLTNYFLENLSSQMLKLLFFILRWKQQKSFRKVHIWDPPATLESFFSSSNFIFLQTKTSKIPLYFGAKKRLTALKFP